MAKKVGKYLFLIKTKTGIILTDKCPPEVAVHGKQKLWQLRGLPSGKIGVFDQRFLYNSSTEDPIGVFRADRLKDLKNLLACYEAHIRKSLQPLPELILTRPNCEGNPE